MQNPSYLHDKKIQNNGGGDRWPITKDESYLRKDG